MLLFMPTSKIHIGNIIEQKFTDSGMTKESYDFFQIYTNELNKTYRK